MKMDHVKIEFFCAGSMKNTFLTATRIKMPARLRGKNGGGSQDKKYKPPNFVLSPSPLLLVTYRMRFKKNKASSMDVTKKVST